MPSKSKSQQRFMGMVYGLKKGEVPSSDVSAKVKKAASSISKSDAEDFASTKHKGKPEKVKKETMVRELIRKLVREVMAEMSEEVNEAKERNYKELLLSGIYQITIRQKHHHTKQDSTT